MKYSYFYLFLKCLEIPSATWERRDTNFDNIYKAMISLFIVGSLEGWPDIMYYAIDQGTDETVILVFDKD